MSLISGYGLGMLLDRNAKRDDNAFVMQHVFTEDESDISYRNVTNKTDGAVKVRAIKNYAEKIKKLRAERERAAQLDAFNYLYGKNLSL